VGIEFRGVALSEEEVCRTLAWQGPWEELLLDALRIKCMPDWARRISVTVTDDEIQAVADSYRRERDFYEADEFQAFLQQACLSEDDFADYCHAQALRRAVRDHLGTPERIQTYFMAHLGKFDRARISRIVVDDEELAKELRMRVVEDGEDFHRLAREYSRDEETRYAGGYVGLVRRKDLGREASARVFASEEGSVLEALEEDERYHVILVEELLKAHLDDELREEIKDCLLHDWESSHIGGGRSE
jgi:parvulin-like peptidyl-prolyl isomerase